MTRLLKEAFERASKLSAEVQDEIAQALIEEIEWEQEWDKSLAASQDVLDRMGRAALEQYEQGRTQERGFDEL